MEEANISVQFSIYIVLYLKCKKTTKNIVLNYSKDTSRMVAYHFYSLDKNGQIYRYGWNLNMANIECIFERRVNWATILLKYQAMESREIYLLYIYIG